MGAFVLTMILFGGLILLFGIGYLISVITGLDKYFK